MALKHKPEEPIEQRGAPGYAPSGSSLWERNAAHGKHVDTTPTRERVNWSRLDVMVKHETAQVGRLRRRIEAETDPAKIAVLLDRITKTRTLLARLRAEQMALVP